MSAWGPGLIGGTLTDGNDFGRYKGGCDGGIYEFGEAGNHRCHMRIESMALVELSSGFFDHVHIGGGTIIEDPIG